MAKKPSETKSILSLEENFLKMMEGGSDLGTDLDSFFEESLESPPESEIEGSVPSLKGGEDLGAPSTKETKIVRRDALKECGLTLNVAKDHMVAHLTGNNAKSFTSESLVKALEEKGVIQGINFDSIVQITSILKKEDSWTGKIVVARGVLPTEQEKISFPFIEKGDWDDPEKGWVVDGKKLSFTPLIDLFSKKEIPDEEEILKVVVRPVSPGEALAIIEAKQDPAPGFDIYGRSIPVGKPMLVPGKKVKRNDKTGNYEAMSYGYLCIKGDVISVVSPILVSQDNMAAYFVNCPHQGTVREPTVTSIKYSLIMKGIAERRIYQSLIEKLCIGLKQDKITKPLIKLASGVEPVQGRDSTFELGVDLEKRAGTVLKDDSIDLKDRNVIHSVSKGDLLATKHFCSTGKPGITLFNKKIKQTPGVDLEINIKGPIVRKRHEDKAEYYAKVAGNVTFEDNTLTLTDVYRVDGNVDYATGNIDVKTGLIVTGSIMPGFKVIAGGHTLIGGTVENGAHVLVQGNLNVAKGIIGKDTKVIVLGSLQAEFIQDAEIMVKSDVEIGSYSFNGIIRSGGEIVIKKSAAQRGGKVVGGIVCATKGISISTLGGPANKNTLAAIQRDVESLAVLKKIQAEIQNCTGTIMKIMKSLKLEAVDMNLIRNLLEKTPPDKREMLIKVVDNLNKLIKMRKDLFDKEKSLEGKVALALKKAKIRIKSESYMGNKVRIGDHQITLDRDVGPAVFELQDDKIIF